MVDPRGRPTGARGAPHPTPGGSRHEAHPDARGGRRTALRDATKFDGYKAKIQAASKAVDAELAAMASGPDAAKANAFKPVWDAFKATRENEIVPAIYAGDKEKAKGLATGVQAGRMKEMKATMGCP